MITAPFNFVPLSDKVFFPDWAEQVSHDVPFEDGESGVIDITITAKSPIFIRDHENPEQFCSHNGEYYIPSTSVKGMVRSVLEIMSFGKIPIDNKIHDKTMSVRDMTNRTELVGTASGCGFLKQDENSKWIIVDYGSPRTIKYSNIQNKTIQNGNKLINCNFETAQEKYDYNGLYETLNIKTDIKDLIDKNGKKIGTQKIATISTTGEEAYLILTGGIDNKKNEFVFVKSDKAADIIDIDKAVEKFKKVYFTSASVDGNFWNNNYNPNIGIPIFYKKIQNRVTDIGLSQLFKLAYNYTINDVTRQQEKFIDVKINNKEEKDIALDLAQTIFGAVRKKATSLKGRVQVSHFKSNSNPHSFDTVRTVLGSPNPSFYPEYIQQNCKNDGKIENDKYNTLMDVSSKIAGWKRYPLRHSKPKWTQADEGTDSATTFTPIGTYSSDEFNEFTFTGKLRYHNLKKVELGALISALTFHDNQDHFYHNIGMAKSLGFGKIKIDIDKEKYQEYLIEYEGTLRTWSLENLTQEWIETDQIKELFSMSFKDLNIDNKLKYLKLDPEKRINEFTDKKKNKECLPKVSQLFDLAGNYPKSLLTEEVLAKIEEEVLVAKEDKIYQIKLNEAKNTDNIQIIKNFIEKYFDREAVVDLKKKIQGLEKAQKENRFSEVDKKAKLAWETVQKKKSNQKQYQKELDKFMKKWKAEKNNKGSEFVLNLLKKLS